MDLDNPSYSTTPPALSFAAPAPNNTFQNAAPAAPPIPTTPTPPTTSSPFGFLVSGSPVRTDFMQVDSTKYTCRLTCPGNITAPLSSVSEVALFLLQPLPAQHGVLCYWQLSSSDPTTTTEFELLGALTAEEPSRIFYTGWGEHEQVVAASSSSSSTTPLTLTIGLSLEPMSHITNLRQNHSDGSSGIGSNSKHPTRMHVAQKIAMDLFQFMQSFDTGTAAGGVGNMVVPNNIFDRWIQRFENRLRRNPNFFLKSQD